VQDGNDVYLTIDVGIQKRIETIIKPYYDSLKADSISVLVYDPMNGQIKASANYPTYNPNNYNDAFQLQPLGQSMLLWWMILVMWKSLYLFLLDEHIDLQRPSKDRMLLFPNILLRMFMVPKLWIDNNISRAYETWKCVQGVYCGDRMDTDEIRFYDPYTDPNKVSGRTILD